ncbi:MAG: dipeptide ABC transporter ATP-binding protein [Pseudomonadota bacterium]
MTTLSVRNLDVTFSSPAGDVAAVRDLHFSIGPRETLGIVGESGSGKTQAMLAMLGLLAANGRASGSVRLDDLEILNRPEAELRRIRGRRIGLVFQDPMQSLNPYLSIGRQLELVVRQHRRIPSDQRHSEIIAMLDAVRIPAAKRRLRAYPHEFSGGMRQRVLIAMALLSRPEVLVADEPTTALDVTVQAGILALLHELRDAFGMGLVLISHDLGVIAGNCESMLVMEDGRVVESGATRTIFEAPEERYTRRLLAAVPRIDGPGRPPPRASTQPLLNVDQLSVAYPLPRQLALQRDWFAAVREVSLTLAAGETLGVVGESGCGKSSLVRSIVGIADRSAGEIRLTGPDGRALVPGRDVQMVFQDPLASLNPRMRIVEIICEPLDVHFPELSAADRRARVLDMLERVGLNASMAERFPHEFSGGQCQRIGIARALVTQPALLICDEALSSLDVSVQADIVDLLLGLQDDLQLAMLFIAHDLAVVRRVSHRLLVMYLGRVVESGPADRIYGQPAHPYTRALLDAAPRPDVDAERRRRRDDRAIDMPAPWSPPSGCAYRTRCAFAEQRCAESVPSLSDTGTESLVACHRWSELPDRFSGD